MLRLKNKIIIINNKKIKWICPVKELNNYKIMNKKIFEILWKDEANKNYVKHVIKVNEFI
jgi:hypothetical protein